MSVPYVIDNQEHRLADVLNDILNQHGGRSLDMNWLNRSTKEGKAAVVNLCLHIGIGRITVTPDKVR